MIEVFARSVSLSVASFSSTPGKSRYRVISSTRAGLVAFRRIAWKRRSVAGALRRAPPPAHPLHLPPRPQNPSALPLQPRSSSSPSSQRSALTSPSALPHSPLFTCTLPPTCHLTPSVHNSSASLDAHHYTYHAFVCTASPLDGDGDKGKTKEKGDHQCGRIFPGERLLELHLTEVHDSLTTIRSERGEKIVRSLTLLSVLLRFGR
jgi:hypothetical protein